MQLWSSERVNIAAQPNELMKYESISVPSNLIAAGKLVKASEPCLKSINAAAYITVRVSCYDELRSAQARYFSGTFQNKKLLWIAWFIVSHRIALRCVAFHWKGQSNARVLWPKMAHNNLLDVKACNEMLKFYVTERVAWGSLHEIRSRSPLQLQLLMQLKIASCWLLRVLLLFVRRARPAGRPAAGPKRIGLEEAFKVNGNSRRSAAASCKRTSARTMQYKRRTSERQQFAPSVQVSSQPKLVEAAGRRATYTFERCAR